MYEILVGEIRADLRRNWKGIIKETDPNKILMEAIVRRKCSIGMLPAAGKLLHNEKQIGWGSFAWCARKKDIARLFRSKGYKDDLSMLRTGKVYGVVYIDD